MSRFLSVIAGPPSEVLGELLELRYLAGKIVNSGHSFCIVSAEDKNTKQKVIIKAFNRVHARDGAIDRDLAWLKATRTSDGRHSLFLRHHESSVHRYLVFEAPAMTLQDLLANDDANPIPEMHIKEIADQVIRAVAALHVEMVSHTDISPDTVEFRDSRFVDVSIYAGSGQFEPKKFLVCTALRVSFYGCVGISTAKRLGSEQYRAPEITYGWPFMPESDIYAIGCIIAEMLAGREIFVAASCPKSLVREKTLMYLTLADHDAVDFRRKVLSLYPGIDLDLKRMKEELYKRETYATQSRILHVEGVRRDLLKFPVAWDLINRMLDLDPPRRIPLIESLRHVFFTKRFRSYF